MIQLVSGWVRLGSVNAPDFHAPTPIYHEAPRGASIWDTVSISSLARCNCTAAAINNFSDCNPTQPFRDGNRYCLRLMNMAALAPFDFSIDDHEFRVISAVKEPLHPSELINPLLINAGQRYDIVVQAKNASDYSSSNPTRSFWMRAKALSGRPWAAVAAKEGFNDEALAIVHYSDEEGRSLRHPHSRTRRPSANSTVAGSLVLPEPLGRSYAHAARSHVSRLTSTPYWPSEIT